MLIDFDLKFGYLYFGGILFVNKMVCVFQGSPIYPGIADMVLSVIEEINSNIFIYESKKWQTFVIRWVDDIWFALVCFIRTDLPETMKTKCIKSALLTGEERFDMFRKAYKCKGLCIKKKIHMFLPVLWCLGMMGISN